MAGHFARPIIAALMVAGCLAAAGFATAQPEPPLMLSQILTAPLRAGMDRSKDGTPLPSIALVKDLLVAADGRVDVIVETGGSGPGPAATRLVPWGDLVYDAKRNEFRFPAGKRSLDEFEAFAGPVQGTLGTANGLLASKLLEGLVKSPGGESMGEVKDVQLRRDGTIQQVFFTRDQVTATLAWSAVEVRPEYSAAAPSPRAEAVIVVDRKKL